MTLNNFAALDIHISLSSQTIFSIGGFSVTNAMLTGLMSMLIFVGVFTYTSQMIQRSRRNRFVAFVQWVYEGVVAQINGVIADPVLARRITPLGVTIFFYVLVSYWMSILPGMESITIHGVPLIRSVAADLNFTFALSIIALITVQAYAIRQHGGLGNIKRYVKNPIKDPIGAFEGLLELIGELSRYSALSLRLFGNCFAGEILLIIITALSGYLASFVLPFFMIFELFIGFIQSYVFLMLTVIFTALALEVHSVHEKHTSHSSHPRHSPADSTTTPIISRE